ncbi:MAG: hypothetical protein JXR76_21780 [Deltaproteobacteria bacterium]|nr:hypothetical protein [Deltaproteobacteria bacterium]
MRKNGQTFKRVDAVLKQSHKDKPQSQEERRSMNPKFFALDKWRRIDVIKRYKALVSRYWQALKEWKRGRRDVRFPLVHMLCEYIRG